MLISVQHLLDRARHPRSRADELAQLRSRFRCQPSAHEVSPERRQLALRLRTLRQEMSAALADVEACSGCARGHPQPAGRWDGGHCCGGQTLRIFTAAEVSALKLGGTRLGKMRPPKSDHAGCVFRGPRGCSLEPVDRPTICLRYICLDLRRELRAQPRWRRVSQLARELGTTFDALSA